MASRSELLQTWKLLSSNCFISLLLVVLFLIPSTGLAQAPYSWQLSDENGLPSMTIYQMVQDEQGFIWIGTENGICRYNGITIELFNSPFLKGNEIIHVKVDLWNRIWFVNLEGQLFYIEEDEIKRPNLQFGSEDIHVYNIFFVDQQLFIIENSIQQSEQQIYVLSFDHQGVVRSKKTLIPSLLKKYFSIHKDQEGIIICGKEITHQYNQSYYRLTDDQNEIEKCDYVGNHFFDRLFKTGSYRNGFIFLGPKRVKWSSPKDSLMLYEHKELGIINSFFADEDLLWLLTNKGIIQLLPGKPTKPRTFFPHLRVSTMLKDHENNYWIGTQGQGIHIIPSFNFQHFNTENSPLQENKIYSLYVDKKGRKLLGQDENILTIIESDTSYKKVALGSTGRVLSILQNNDDQTICIGDENIALLDKDYNLMAQNGQGGNKTAIFDAKNHLWIGQSHSTYYLENYLRMFFSQGYASQDTFYTKLKNVPAIAKARTYALHLDFEQQIWIGTTQGLFVYQDSLRPFFKDNGQNYYSINAITQSSDSTIWVATETDGLLAIRADSIYRQWKMKDGLSSNRCRKLCTDDYKQLWIGSPKGINRLSLSTGAVQTIDRFDGLPSNEITALYIEGDKVWVGTPKGLSRFSVFESPTNQIAPLIYINGLQIWGKDTTLSAINQLSYDQNNIQIHFKGINYRARGQQNYQYRLLGINDQWVATTHPSVTFPSLSPGTYNFEVVAINEDGLRSERPASIQFHIAAAWWNTWWFFILVGLAITTSVIVFFLLRFKRLQKREQLKTRFQKEINQLKMQALQLQMNPHFIFNALNAIQHFLSVNDQEQAMIYLARFAHLIRLVFEQSKKQLISFAEELELLKLYLDLEQLRFEEKVKIKLHISKGLTSFEEEIVLPPLLVQPVIENAFKHGLLHKKEKGQLSINFNYEHGALICTIKDDGIGRIKAATFNRWRPKRYQSSGLKTTQNRLEVFNRNINPLDQQDYLLIKDLKDEQGQDMGTEVKLKILNAI